MIQRMNIRLNEIFVSLSSAIKRFPCTSVYTLIYAINLIVLFETGWAENAGNLVGKIQVFAVLGISCLIFSEAVIEYWKIKDLWLRVGAVFAALMIVVGCIVYTEVGAQGTQGIHRILGVGILVHLSIALLPSVAKWQEDQFWLFNKELFVRIVLAVFYAGVLFLGLAAALFVLRPLFDIRFDGAYINLAIFCFLPFQTLVFLSGFPSLDQLKKESLEEHRGIRIFSQYLLSFLVIVFSLILSAYFLKIVTSWDWPKGVVSLLVVGVSAAGFLSLLLVYPFQKTTPWLKRYCMWFSALTLLNSTMLVIAAHQRVNQHGLTPPRYYLYAIAAVLILASMRFLIKKGVQVDFVPKLIFSVTVVALFVPWINAFDISLYSQRKRLILAMENIGLFDSEGQLLESAGSIRPPESVDSSQARASVAVVKKIFGEEFRSEWFADTFTKVTSDQFSWLFVDSWGSSNRSRQVHRQKESVLNTPPRITFYPLENTMLDVSKYKSVWASAGYTSEGQVVFGNVSLRFYDIVGRHEDRKFIKVVEYQKNAGGKESRRSQEFRLELNRLEKRLREFVVSENPEGLRRTYRVENVEWLEELKFLSLEKHNIKLIIRSVDLVKPSYADPNLFYLDEIHYYVVRY